MARPLRIEYENAFYHVMSRGNRRMPIFEDDRDHLRFLEILGSVCKRFSWKVWARCEMTNHFHLLIQTLEPTLSRGMRQLKGVYTQWSNARHRTTGHLFEGRYKAILVDADAYLKELIRYIVRNPMEAGIVPVLRDYPWSSHRWMTAGKAVPEWFAKEEALALFTPTHARAVGVYKSFVRSDAFDYKEHLRNQIFLGEQPFIDRVHEAVLDKEHGQEIPAKQQRAAAGLSELDKGQGRDALIEEAYEAGFTLREIGDYVRLHYSTVSRIARRNARDKT